MDRGHDGTLGTNYSPLGIIVQFPVRVTSLCESLVRCALPTRPQQRDARTCVHVRRVEQTTLEGAGETTPRLIFVGHQLAATEQQQGEKLPPPPLPAEFKEKSLPYHPQPSALSGLLCVFRTFGLEYIWITFSTPGSYSQLFSVQNVCHMELCGQPVVAFLHQ